MAAVAINIPFSEEIPSTGTSNNRRRDGVLSNLLQATGMGANTTRPQHGRRKDRRCCSTRMLVFVFLVAVAGSWAIYVLRRMNVATPGGPDNLESARRSHPETRDPSLWPDAQPAPVSTPFSPEAAGIRHTEPSAKVADDPPPPSIDDAYALQRLQAGVDADEGGSWDTGSLGGERARTAVREALLRDHEAALERDRASHHAGEGHADSDHSVAHHHDA